MFSCVKTENANHKGGVNMSNHYRWGLHHDESAVLPVKEEEKSKSNGISPSSFHKLCNNEQLTAILHLAAHNEVVQKRVTFTSGVKRQRDEYYDITKYRVFPLQELAFDFLNEMKKDYYSKKIKEGGDESSTLWSMEPRIFAVETACGKRRYIVGNMGRFMQHYWRETDPIARHYYELIPEGTPCRMYFDLEFNKDANPIITSDVSEVLMSEFIAELCNEYQMIHNICLSRSCIVDLDSSTTNKFSRHLIIHSPNGEIFADSLSVGLFVKRFVGRLAEEQSTGELENRHSTLAKYLFVNKKRIVEPDIMAEADKDVAPRNYGNNHKELTCFVDLGVYTRNRLFRLLGSTKFGHSPSAALRIAEANTFKFPAGFDNNKFYFPSGTTSKAATPLKSFSCAGRHVENDREKDYKAFCASFDWEIHARALALTLVVPIEASRAKSLVLTEVCDGGHDTVKLKDTFSSGRDKLPSRICHGASPILSLDNFILQQSTRGGIQGKIRAWSMEGAHFITYQMSDNRWCENINRAHKSNNIIWNVDLKSNCYWQTCHDPECRAMKSRGILQHLPSEVAADVSDYLVDLELADIDVDEFIHKAKKNGLP
jgi:hypothetical protein